MSDRRSKRRRQPQDTDRRTAYEREITSGVTSLSPAEERDLAIRARAGASEARARLVESHLSLGLKIARAEASRRGCKHLTPELIQAASLGLIAAAEHFDPDHEAGARFATYAPYWIREEIRKQWQRDRLISLPKEVTAKLAKYYRVRDELAHELDHYPRPEEIASALGWSREQLDEVTSQPYAVQMSEDFEDSEPGREPSPLELAERRRQADFVQMLLESLEPRAREVLELRYGIGDDDEWTHAQIGDKLGITRQAVQRIEVRALDRLRKRLRLMGLGPADVLLSESAVRDQPSEVTTYREEAA